MDTVPASRFYSWPNGLHSPRPDRATELTDTIMADVESMDLDTRFLNIFPFLSLPGEMRNLIYSYSLDYNDAMEHMERSRLDWPADSYGRKYRSVRRRTPKILLLNKQITAEALDFQYKKPLVITAPSYLPDPEADWNAGLRLLEVISLRTLQNIQHVVIKFPYIQPEQCSSSWHVTCVLLGKIWQHNHSLQTLIFEASSPPGPWLPRELLGPPIYPAIYTDLVKADAPYQSIFGGDPPTPPSRKPISWYEKATVLEMLSIYNDDFGRLCSWLCNMRDVPDVRFKDFHPIVVPPAAPEDALPGGGVQQGPVLHLQDRRVDLLKKKIESTEGVIWLSGDERVGSFKTIWELDAEGARGEIVREEKDD